MTCFQINEIIDVCCIVIIGIFVGWIVGSVVYKLTNVVRKAHSFRGGMDSTINF